MKVTKVTLNSREEALREFVMSPAETDILRDWMMNKPDKLWKIYLDNRSRFMGMNKADIEELNTLYEYKFDSYYWSVAYKDVEDFIYGMIDAYSPTLPHIVKKFISSIPMFTTYQGRDLGPIVYRYLKNHLARVPNNLDRVYCEWIHPDKRSFNH